MNRRGFLGALLAAPVAGAAVAETAEPSPEFVSLPMYSEDQLLASYEWRGINCELSEGELQALLRENMETLKRGFERDFDLQMYRSI